MATDYDAPRQTDNDEPVGGVVQELAGRRADTQSGSIDVDDTSSEPPEPPGADLSGISDEELTVPVVPTQHDEFVCTSCFLVHHRSRRAPRTENRTLCRDCA